MCMCYRFRRDNLSRKRRFTPPGPLPSVSHPPQTTTQKWPLALSPTNNTTTALHSYPQLPFPEMLATILQVLMRGSE